jgi:hypothetical protein
MPYTCAISSNNTTVQIRGQRLQSLLCFARLKLLLPSVPQGPEAHGREYVMRMSE